MPCGTAGELFTLDQHRVRHAAVGQVLLIGDVLLPVPSTLVMMAHGALFGVVPGTLLSLMLTGMLQFAVRMAAAHCFA